MLSVLRISLCAVKRMVGRQRLEKMLLQQYERRDAGAVDDDGGWSQENRGVAYCGGQAHRPAEEWMSGNNRQFFTRKLGG